MHLKVAEQKGAHLHFNESVVSWSKVHHTAIEGAADASDIDESNSKGLLTTNTTRALYQINTAHGPDGLLTSTYFTRKIILAVGPWAPELYGSELSVRLHVERRIQFWFKPLNPLLFQVNLAYSSGSLNFVLLSFYYRQTFYNQYFCS